MVDPVTREEVQRAIAFLDNERVQQQKFWREAYNETQPGGIGACIMVLRRLAEQWLNDDQQTYSSDNDGFIGTVQGRYITREGKPGLVLQQIGTKVIHVYREERLRVRKV